MGTAEAVTQDGDTTMASDAARMREVLENVLKSESGWVELRWHRKSSRGIGVEDGRVASASARHEDGISVRVIEDGTFGHSSSSTVDVASIKSAIAAARAAAKAAASRRHLKLPVLPSGQLARGDFGAEGVADVLRRPLEEKLAVARDAEKAAKAASTAISSANAAYSEIHEAKAIVTSDGASASFELVRPEFRVTAIAMRDGIREVGTRTRGATGGWDCLFRGGNDTALAEAAAKTAVDLLKAPRPEGGRRTIILDPSIVGLLVHEAIGHTVEADFVAAGSVAAGKLGTRVASDLVTLCDSGQSEHQDGAGGTIPVDDEGVVAGRTCIIERGVLRSYLHDRESAARAGVAPTGNARAFTFEDEPLIRMRNTYIEPGATPFEDIVASTADGYLLEGPKNGQADATGEFMFGVERAWRIRNGKVVGLEKGVTVSGIAFETLMSVDAVSREFRWDLGSGYCGKGQLMKVDAGGPYVRCHALLGSAS